MADFTSSLYLGLRHASATLPGWEALTFGVPAALAESDDPRALADRLAWLQGLPSATLLPSTLHLFWDLLRQLARGARTALFVDAGAYPILHWAADGAAAAGAAVQRFAHHDAHALDDAVRRAARAGLRPVVVCDGFCPGCNRPAPLAAYARAAARHGGMLVVDDTQALGLLGGSPDAACPYGHGGGGSLRWQALVDLPVAVGASLAKAFGAPLAALAGDAALVARFRERSETRLHCSPPSAAAVQAAQRALDVSARRGEGLRARLLRLVLRLRETLADAGLAAVGQLPFPVQSFIARPGIAAQLLQRLRAGGVRALLTRGCEGRAPRLSFIVNAQHGATQIDRVGQLLARIGAVHPHPGLAPAFH